MVEIDNEKADVIIALLAQLVAASTKADPVVTLMAAGMRQRDVARVLGMKANAVGMRVSRSSRKPRGRARGGNNAKS
jgi:hypothetical protein